MKRQDDRPARATGGGGGNHYQMRQKMVAIAMISGSKMIVARKCSR